ncbi:hypothetical protein [Paenibacillus silvisoli]|uniref:hypothetical protein n=1 Tax=Paenibacillus silvisoli TaxID=3110539 RepID=UPI002804C04C|nr:hypothetical protein [Paenibacillus silvisoli]
MSDLYSTVFNMIEARNRHLQSLTVSEGVTDQIELQTSNGDVIAEIHEGVLGQVEMTIGNESATISENVMGGDTIDFGNGDVIQTYTNINGGETFYSLTDVVGYTQSSPIFDGVDFYNGNYEKVASLSNPDMFGNMDVTYSSLLTGESGLDLTAQDWAQFDSTFDVDIDLDGGDTIADILNMIADWS